MFSFRKLQLSCLFALGFFIVAITIIRLPQNASNSTAQVNRTTWASTELLAAAIVANAPVIYGFWRGSREASQYNSRESSSNRFFISRQANRKRAQQGDLDVEGESNDNKNNRVNLGNLPPGMSSSTALRSSEATYSRTQPDSRSLDPRDGI